MSSQKFGPASPKRPRRRIITINLESSSSSSSDEEILTSYPRLQSKGPVELAKAAAAIPNLIHKMPNSQRRQTVRDESPAGRGQTALKNLACPRPTLPAFLPQIDPHKNWSYSRVFSQEIYEVMEKHLRKFDGTYLSRSLFGEVFFERINDSDAEFDQSVFFQAVVVDELGPLFQYGKDGQRIRFKCSEASTINNAAASSEEKERIVVALDSLAELLSIAVKPGDYLVLFGDILIEKERVICINSRQRHPVSIAHYRHNGVFNGCTREGPIALKNSLKNVQKYCQCIHELEPNESRYDVEPNTSKELVLQPDPSLDHQVEQGNTPNRIRNSSRNLSKHPSSINRPSSSGLTGSKAAEMVRSTSRSPPPKSPKLMRSPWKLHGRRDRSTSESKDSDAEPAPTVKPRRMLSPQKLIEQVRRSGSKVPSSTAPISNLRVPSSNATNSKASNDNVTSKPSQINSKRSHQSTSQSSRNRSQTPVSLASQVSRCESSPELFIHSSSSEDDNQDVKSKTSDSESRLSLDIEKEIDAGRVLDSKSDSPQPSAQPSAKRYREQGIFTLKDCYISLSPIPGLSSSKKSASNKKKKRGSK